MTYFKDRIWGKPTLEQSETPEAVRSDSANTAL